MTATLVWLLDRHDVRAALVAVGKRATGQAAEVAIPDSAVVWWITEHALVVRWVVVVVGLVVLAMTASSWLGIILTIVAVLSVQSALSLVVGQWPFAGPEGSGTRRA